MLLDPVPDTIRPRIPTDSLLAFIWLSKQSSPATYSVGLEEARTRASQSCIPMQCLKKLYRV